MLSFILPKWQGAFLFTFPGGYDYRYRGNCARANSIIAEHEAMGGHGRDVSFRVEILPRSPYPEKNDNKPFETLCKLDEQGGIIANESTVTSTPGVYAAGDCRTQKVRQVVTAAGDGAVAAMNACRFVESIEK